MAANHIITDPAKAITRDIHRYTRMAKEGMDGLKRAFDAMHHTADGDRNDAAEFDQTVTVMGISQGDYATAGDAALALYNETNSVVGNYTTNVKAALDQLNAYLGLS